MPGSSKFRNLVSTKIKNTAHIIFKMEGTSGGHKQMEGAFILATNRVIMINNGRDHAV